MIKKISGKIYFIILISICMVFFDKNTSFAFTLGPIEVQSKFGERFKARVEVYNDGESGLEASIGSSEEYQLFNIKRSQLVDDIYLEVTPDPDFGDKQIIKLTSSKVLFYPSLELVIKADLNGGTILEKYILAVDFRQSLFVSLSSEPPDLPEKVRDEKKALPPVKVASESITNSVNIKNEEVQDNIAYKKISAKLTTYASASEKVEQDEQVSEIQLSNNDYEDVSVESLVPLDLPIALNKNDVVPSTEDEKTEDTHVAPYPIINTAEKDPDEIEKRYLTLLAYYNVNSDNNPIETISDTDDLKSQISNKEYSYAVKSTQRIRMTYGPVKEGETLYRIAKNLNVRNYTVAQVVVALWEMNKEKFAKYNMHGLEQNVYLDYTDIEEVLKSLSINDAVSAMLDQKASWEDTKTLSKEPLSVQITDNEKLYKLVAPPVVDLSYRKNIYRTIINWKEKWEKNEIDSMMGQYSKEFKTEEIGWDGWMERKKNFNSRHNNISISIEDLEMLRINNDDEDIVYASFIQIFSSDDLQSKGLKSLKLKKEVDRWMIVEELFDNTIKTGKNSPYVVHISSFNSIDKAVIEVNKWRERGFIAYYAFYNILEKGSWYRVFLDRFSYRNIANKFVEDLRQKGLTDYAAIMDMPYALELGTYETDKDALDIIQNIQVQNSVSPYLFAVNDGENLSFKILLSAYTKEEQAIKLSAELKEINIEHKVVIP